MFPHAGLADGVVTAGTVWLQAADVDRLRDAGAFAVGVDRQENLQSVSQLDQRMSSGADGIPPPCWG